MRYYVQVKCSHTEIFEVCYICICLLYVHTGSHLSGLCFIVLLFLQMKLYLSYYKVPSASYCHKVCLTFRMLWQSLLLKDGAALPCGGHRSLTDPVRQSLGRLAGVRLTYYSEWKVTEGISARHMECWWESGDVCGAEPMHTDLSHEIAGECMIRFPSCQYHFHLACHSSAPKSQKLVKKFNKGIFLEILMLKLFCFGDRIH